MGAGFLDARRERFSAALGHGVVELLGANTLVLLTSLYGATLATYAIAGLTFRRLLRWYTLPLLFIISVAGPLAFLEPGTPIGGSIGTPIGEASVTWVGATLFVELTCRSLTVVTFVLATTVRLCGRDR